MKKTMFITSVIMVLVLAVALTTSSLAWFQATNGAKTVSATAISVTASAAPSSEGGLLASTAASGAIWKTSPVVLNGQEGHTGASLYPTGVVCVYDEETTSYVPVLTSNAPVFDAASTKMIEKDSSNRTAAAVKETGMYYVGDMYVANGAGNRDASNVVVSIAVAGVGATEATDANKDYPVVNVLVLAQEMGEDGSTLEAASIVHFNMYNGNTGEVVSSSSQIYLTGIIGTGANNTLAVNDIMELHSESKTDACLYSLSPISKKLPQMPRMEMDQSIPHAKDVVKLTMYVWLDGSALTANASKNLTDMLEKYGKTGVSVTMSITDNDAAAS